MRNDSALPIFIASLVFGGFVDFEMNRRIEHLKEEVIDLQIYISKESARNVQQIPQHAHTQQSHIQQPNYIQHPAYIQAPTQGFYHGR